MKKVELKAKLSYYEFVKVNECLVDFIKSGIVKNKNIRIQKTNVLILKVSFSSKKNMILVRLKVQVKLKPHSLILNK